MTRTYQMMENEEDIKEIFRTICGVWYRGARKSNYCLSYTIKGEIILEFEKILSENFTDKNQLIIVLCQFLKKNHELSKKNIDLSVLKFLYQLNPSGYILGTSDQDYTSLKEYFISRRLTKKDQLKESVMLIWDLISYMTDEVCPSCNQANLRLYTDIHCKDVYAACEECFSCRKDGVWVTSNEELYPANSYLVHQYFKKDANE